MKPQIKKFLLLAIFALLAQRTSAITIHDIASLPLYPYDPYGSYTFDVFGVPPGPLSLVDNGSEEWSVRFKNFGFRTPTQLEVIVVGQPVSGRHPESEDLQLMSIKLVPAFMQQFQKSLEISSYQEGLEPPNTDLPPNHFDFYIDIPDREYSAGLLLLSLCIFASSDVAQSF